MFKFKRRHPFQGGRNVLALSLLALGLGLGAAIPVSAQPSKVSVGSRIAESPFKNAVHFSQHYSLTGQRTLNQKRGPITKTSSDFGIVQNVISGAPTDFAGMPRAMAPPNQTTEVVLSQDEALKRSAAWVQANAQPAAREMAEMLNKTASGMGILTYSEEIKVSRAEGEPVLKVVSFIMSVDRSGKALYGAPVITSPDPDVLYVIYTPLRMGDDMKEQNQFANPGTITYNLLDSKGNKRTEPKVINVGGAYDSQAGDPTKVPCLLDRRNPGCSLGMASTDVLTLMNQYAAEATIVDYINQVIPVYDEIPGTNSVEPELRPRMAVSYTDRTYDCKIYTNEGEYGFVLDISVDRYLGILNGKSGLDYHLLGQEKYQSISSVGHFKKSVPVNQISGNPKNSLISPVIGDNSVFRYDEGVFAFIQYVSPVRLTGSDDFLANADNSNPQDFPLVKKADAGGAKTYVWGIECDSCFRSLPKYEGKLVFNIEDASGIDIFTISNINYDDWAVIYLNNVPVVMGPTGYKDFDLSDTKQFECEDRDGAFHCKKNLGLDTPWTIFSKNPEPGKATCIKDDNSQAGYYCGTTLQCAETLVSAFDFSGGFSCHKIDRGANYVINQTFNLKTGLMNGRNELRAKVLQAGGGELFSTLIVKGCGANMDLNDSTVPLPVPPEGTGQAILDKLRNNTDTPLEKPPAKP